MTGELSSAREPGLILTPLETASKQDDGKLRPPSRMGQLRFGWTASYNKSGCGGQI